MTDFELLDSETIWEGHIASVHVERFPRRQAGFEEVLILVERPPHRLGGKTAVEVTGDEVGDAGVRRAMRAAAKRFVDLRAGFA